MTSPTDPPTDPVPTQRAQMMAAPMSSPTITPDRLADPADLLRMPGVPDTLTLDAAGLLIELATAVIQNVTGQRIVQVTDDAVVIQVDRDDAGQWLQLPELPVSSVSAVSVGVLPVADWTLDTTLGRIWRPLGWRSIFESSRWRAPSTATVTYTHGLVLTDPKAQFARMVALSLAAGATSVGPGVTQERVDDYMVAYDGMAARLEATPAMVAGLRRQYTRPARSIRLMTRGRW